MPKGGKIEKKPVVPPKKATKEEPKKSEPKKAIGTKKASKSQSS